MISIDLSNLKFRALNVQGCYMVDIFNEHRVKCVLLKGEKNHNVLYCDVNNNFAIIHKTDVTGNIVLVNGEFVYDLFFGKVEVLLE